jgi:histidine triad (HIT) family protein
MIVKRSLSFDKRLELADLFGMTIFSKIIAGQIPSYKISETNNTYSFLDIKPHNLGHTLVVPKAEIASFEELPDDLREEVFAEAAVLCKAIKKATKCQRVGLLVHGLGVPEHFHLHLIPIFESNDLDQSKAHPRTDEEMQHIHQEILSYLK